MFHCLCPHVFSRLNLAVGFNSNETKVFSSEHRIK